MEVGFCIAGIPEGSSRWVRPVKRSGQIEGRDLADSSGRIIHPLDLVEFELLRARPERPHVEDWLANFLRRPVVQHRPSEQEREVLLGRLVETSLDAVLKAKSRSLVLVEPDSITAAWFLPGTPDRSYQVRLSLSAAGVHYEGESARPGYPCTDLRLRNWGRRFASTRVLNDRQLREALEVRRIFLVIGLSRRFNNNYWPMVVGFHACPDFSAQIDLSNP